jgi:hypothetical protein
VELGHITIMVEHMEKFHKLELAEIQLNRAIILFLDEEEYVSSITLAGAADEILGKYVRKLGGQTSIDMILNLVVSRGESQGLSAKEYRSTYMNGTKNALKHHDGSSDNHLTKDWEIEAISLIFRASMNFHILANKFNEYTLAFMKHMRFSRQDLFEGLGKDVVHKFDSMLN